MEKCLCAPCDDTQTWLSHRGVCSHSVLLQEPQNTTGHINTLIINPFCVSQQRHVFLYAVIRGVITAVPLTCDLLYKCLKEEIACSYSSLSLTVSVLQRTNTCSRQTGSQVRNQRALWVSKWSTSQITAWRGPAWSSTRSRRSPRCITSNTTTTSTSTCMIWWRPPRTDCPGSSSADGSSPTRPFIYLLKCYSLQFSSSGRRCAEDRNHWLIISKGL